jgi:hypothetical protein
VPAPTFTYQGFVTGTAVVLSGGGLINSLFSFVLSPAAGDVLLIAFVNQESFLDPTTFTAAPAWTTVPAPWTSLPIRSANLGAAVLANSGGAFSFPAAMMIVPAGGLVNPSWTFAWDTGFRNPSPNNNHVIPYLYQYRPSASVLKLIGTSTMRVIATPGEAPSAQAMSYLPPAFYVAHAFVERDGTPSSSNPATTFTSGTVDSTSDANGGYINWCDVKHLAWTHDNAGIADTANNNPPFVGNPYFQQRYVRAWWTISVSAIFSLGDPGPSFPRRGSYANPARSSMPHARAGRHFG